jgi:hypothetical protein
MRIKMNKVLISAKCQNKSKRIIKDSKYTYGDAMDFFAKVITNSTTRLKAEIQYTKSEIDDLHREQEKTSQKLIAKNNYLENLMEEWKSRRGNYQQNIKEDPEIKESINSIICIAANFNCQPTHINDFTGRDTIGYHARKCGLSRYELEELIRSQ